MRRSGHMATSMVLLLLCLMYFITYVDRVNISQAAIYFRPEFGLSNADYGTVFAAFSFTYAMFQIVGGFIADRFGPRLTLGVCGVIWALTTFFTGFAGGFWSLIAFRLVLGFGEGATFPTATRAMSAWTRKGKRGFAQGITHSFSRAGNAVAAPIVAYLALAWSWRGSFFVIGAVSLVWVIAWYLYFRDDPREHPQISAEELEGLPPLGTSKEAPQIPWGRLVPRMMPTTVVYFCYGWTLWVFLSWLPQFFKTGQAMSPTAAAWSTAIVGIGGIIGDTVGGMVSDAIYERTGDLAKARRNVIIVSFLGALVFLLPLFYTRDAVLVTGCLAITFFFIELTIGPIWSVSMDIAPKFAGTASGIMNTGSAIAAIVAPIGFAKLLDWTGSWAWPFSASIALLVIGAILTFWMRPDRQVEA